MARIKIDPEKEKLIKEYCKHRHEAAGTNILRHDKDLKSYFVAMIILKPHVHTQLAFVPELDLEQYEKRLKDE